MTPPGSVGLVGLPDGQWTDSHDPGRPVYSLSGAQVGNAASAIFASSPYERAHTSFTLIVGQVRLNISWYNDELATQFVGQHSIVCDAANQGTLLVNLPHEGPYFQVKVIVQTGASNNWTADLFTYNTNRISWAPINPAATGQGFTSGILAGGASVTLPLNFYYMGGVWLRAVSGDQPTTFTFQTINGSDNGYSVFANFTVAASSSLNQFFFVPGDACILVIKNIGSAAFTFPAAVNLRMPWQGAT